jgi:hypothetical protein
VAPAAPKGPVVTVNLPDGPDGSSFATLLVTTPVTNWSPTDDRSFQYGNLTFLGDGTFIAAAALSAGGESVPCQEGGSWSVEAVESPTIGTIEMTLEDTDCATRQPGGTQRIRISREADYYRIAYR